MVEPTGRFKPLARSFTPMEIMDRLRGRSHSRRARPLRRRMRGERTVAAGRRGKAR